MNHNLLLVTFVQNLLDNFNTSLLEPQKPDFSQKKATMKHQGHKGPK